MSRGRAAISSRIRQWGRRTYSQIVEYDPPYSSISIGPGGIAISAFTSRNIDHVEPDGKGGSTYKQTLLF